jgi:hypothetical protein
MPNFTTDRSQSATTTQQCARKAVLVDPELLKFLQIGVLCKVQLVSEELELDTNEVLVPKDWKVIKLLVKDDSKKTIEQIVASTPEFQGYKVVDCWQVINGAQPF